MNILPERIAGGYGMLSLPVFYRDIPVEVPGFGIQVIALFSAAKI